MYLGCRPHRLPQIAVARGMGTWGERLLYPLLWYVAPPHTSPPCRPMHFSGFSSSCVCSSLCRAPPWLGCLSCLPCLLVHHQAWQSSRLGLHGSAAVPCFCCATLCERGVCM